MLTSIVRLKILSLEKKGKLGIKAHNPTAMIYIVEDEPTEVGLQRMMSYKRKKNRDILIWWVTMKKLACDEKMPFGTKPLTILLWITLYISFVSLFEMIKYKELL